MTKKEQQFLDLVAEWGVQTLTHGTDDQIAALALGLQTLIALIINPPPDPIEREQMLERAVTYFFVT